MADASTAGKTDSGKPESGLAAQEHAEMMIKELDQAPASSGAGSKTTKASESVPLPQMTVSGSMFATVSSTVVDPNSQPKNLTVSKSGIPTTTVSTTITSTVPIAASAGSLQISVSSGTKLPTSALSIVTEATTKPDSQTLELAPSSSTTAAAAGTAKTVTSTHLRIPTVPSALARTVTNVMPRAPGTISIARAGVAGQHRLPVAPVLTPVSSRLPQVSVAFLHQPAEGAKLTVVQTGANAAAEAKSSPATIRPMSQSVSLTPGLPVTIRGCLQAKSVGSTANPIQLVPLAGSVPGVGNRPVTGGSVSGTVVTAVSTAVPTGTTIISQGNLRHVAKATTPMRTPSSETPSVRVTLVQSPATITKVVPASGASGSPSSQPIGTGILKPVTITSQTPRHLRPQTMTPAGSQPMRVATPSGAKMTVVPAPGHTQTVSVALNPSQINVPVVPSSQHGQQPQMARILTQSGATRLISVPSSPGGGVTIQKAVVTTTLAGTKTISLPYAANQSASSPKTIGTLGNAIPVARVIPQLAGPVVTPVSESGLFITRPLVSHMQLSTTASGSNSGSSLIVTTLPSQVQTATSRSPQKQASADTTHVTISQRPGILRRREIDREHVIDVSRPDSRDGGGSSSGSTTLSATSSPCDTGNISGEELAPAGLSGPSPRKKPRKQQHSNVRGPSWSDSEDQNHQLGLQKSKNVLAPVREEEAFSVENCSYLKRKPQMSLLNSYRHTWKSRHNHFLRHNDVRPKEERKPTVNELASQNNVLQRINGWKVYHLCGQIEDIIDIEVELSKKLSSLQKKLDKMTNRDLHKEVATVQEIIKANLQRSKVIQDQIGECKEHSVKLFDHKSRVRDIINRYLRKRNVRKREL